MLAHSSTQRRSESYTEGLKSLTVCIQISQGNHGCHFLALRQQVIVERPPDELPPQVQVAQQALIAIPVGPKPTQCTCWSSCLLGLKLKLCWNV